MVAYGQQVSKIVHADPNVAGAMLDVNSSGAGANTASLNIMLKTLGAAAQADGRPGGGESAPQAQQPAPASMSSSPIPRTINIGGRSSRSTYQYTLQGLDLTQLQDVSTQLEDAAEGPCREFVGVNSDFDKATPVGRGPYRPRPRRRAGRHAAQIENAMGYAFGGQQVSQIYDFVGPVSGDAGTAAADIRATPPRCARSISPPSNGAAGAAVSAVTTTAIRHHAAAASTIPANCRR